MRARTAAAVLVGCALIVAGAAYYVSIAASGTLTIRIRDAPVSWSHVVVTFSQVSARPADAPNGTGWVPLSLQVTQIDFLALGNLTRLLTLDHLAPRAFAAIRIVVSAVSGVLASGLPVAMTVTGGMLETAVAFAVRGGVTTTLTFDLHLAQSIQQSGGGWVFAPTLGPVEVG